MTSPGSLWPFENPVLRCVFNCSPLPCLSVQGMSLVPAVTELVLAEMLYLQVGPACTACTGLHKKGISRSPVGPPATKLAGLQPAAWRCSVAQGQPGAGLRQQAAAFTTSIFATKAFPGALHFGGVSVAGCHEQRHGWDWPPQTPGGRGLFLLYFEALLHTVHICCAFQPRSTTTPPDPFTCTSTPPEWW